MEMASVINDMRDATLILAQGDVIIYPTDTVYGLGADATNTKAVACVRTLKDREADKPILAIVADTAMLERYAVMTPLARALALEFWPGPLTIVLDTTNDSLASIVASDGSAGFRVPAHKFARELAYGLGRPITSTSVNRSGVPPQRTATAMRTQLNERECSVARVIDHGVLIESAPSTVVDARGSVLQVLREGAVSYAALQRFL